MRGVTATSMNRAPRVLRTAEELAARTPVSSATIRRRIREGSLPATKPPGSSCWLIDESDFSRWLVGSAVPARSIEEEEAPVPPYLSAAQAAELVGLDAASVEAALKRGLLRGYRPDGIDGWVVAFSDLNAWVTGRARPRPAADIGADELLTTAQLAARTPFSKWKICDLIRRGAFPAVKPAGSRGWLVRMRDFELWRSGEDARVPERRGAAVGRRVVPLPPYIGVGELADLVGVSWEIVATLLERGVIDGHRPEGTSQWVVTDEAVHGWVGGHARGSGETP